MNKPLARKITIEQLTAIDRPIELATGMPNAAYADRDFFWFEREHVLGAAWAALAFTEDYKENGTVSPIEFMGRAAAGSGKEQAWRCESFP